MQKVAIITGGAQGIGRGITQFFHKKGIQTVVFDNDPEAGKEIEEILSGTMFINGDVSNERDVKNTIQSVIEKYKQINYIINNVGIGIFKSIEELTIDEWNKVLGVNLTSIFLMAKYSQKWLLQTKGSIINIASTRAFMSEPNTESYSATKGGVVSLTHALAISLGPEIKVNCISPGWIEVSDFQKKTNAKQPLHTDEDKKQHPVGRVGRPDDISNFIYNLISEDDSFITGQNFIIDGGMTKKMIYV